MSPGDILRWITQFPHDVPLTLSALAAHFSDDEALPVERYPLIAFLAIQESDKQLDDGSIFNSFTYYFKWFRTHHAPLPGRCAY